MMFLGDNELIADSDISTLFLARLWRSVTEMVANWFCITLNS
jgi:hypothetical protein